ncbi:DUF1559 family PulG-like putative transporter [Bremerella volcania]|nr:DUF1559 domain-containing protein [Bremerella volcania]
MMNWGCLLIELVFLWALLVPAVYTPRSASRRMASANNLKQIGLAMHNYYDTYGTLPPAYVADAQGEPLYSWRVLLLPFIEEKKLYEQFHLDEPWSSDHNRKLLNKMPGIYESPFHPGSAEAKGKTPYRAVVDTREERTVLRPTKGRNFREVTDGLAFSALVIDDPVRLVEWTKPEDIDPLHLLALTQIGDNEMHGILVLMGDASYTFIGEANRDELIGMIYCDDGRTGKDES